MKTFFLLISINYMVCGSVTAQPSVTSQNKIKFVEDQHVKLLSGSRFNYLKALQSASVEPFKFKNEYVFSLKQHTSRSAVFCRMENLYREKFNVWIMIHAGDW